MRCSNARKMMPLYYYNDLSENERSVLESHINECIACKREFKEVAALLNDIRPKPLIQGKPFNEYISDVFKRIKKTKSPFELLILKPAVSFAFALVVAVIMVFGIYQYRTYSERQFVMNNYELIRDMDMLDKMEMIKDLDVLESMKEDS